jgi:hypothetical protein
MPGWVGRERGQAHLLDSRSRADRGDHNDGTDDGARQQRRGPERHGEAGFSV